MSEIRYYVLACALAAVGAGTLAAQSLQVSSTSPLVNSGGASPDASIVVTFDVAAVPSSVTPATFRVFGRSTGPVSGAFAWSNGDRTVTFTHATEFSAGELVTVSLADSIARAAGGTLRDGGYTFQFGIGVAAADRDFTRIQTIDVRAGGGATVAYGGFANDLDHDGWIDLGIVNEVSADLRVFPNNDDGSGTFGTLLTPVNAIGVQASPNEVADFDNDGDTDAVTSNTSSDSISILLGRGDGTFDAQVELSTGNTPHGIVVLDVDGDADPDIVNAYAGNGGGLALRLNDGSGGFGPATFFEGGGSAEYSLAAGDMNNDGLLDLVVGTQGDQMIHVLLGQGNGTFTSVESIDAGGATWMIVLGDVNGDRFLDVTSANSGSNNGAVLLGQGDGTLGAATIVASTGQVPMNFIIATDLGDLDGDGDLDWVLSSYGNARFTVFTNDGAGHFTYDQFFSAASAGSCAVLFDLDRDRDLDMVLVDEVADELYVEQNGGASFLFVDGFESGDTSAWSAAVP